MWYFNHCTLANLDGAAAALGWTRRDVLQALESGALVCARIRGTAPRLFLTPELFVYSAKELNQYHPVQGGLLRQFAPVARSRAPSLVVVLPNENTLARACLLLGEEEAMKTDIGQYADFDDYVLSALSNPATNSQGENA